MQANLIERVARQRAADLAARCAPTSLTSAVTGPLSTSCPIVP